MNNDTKIKISGIYRPFVYNGETFLINLKTYISHNQLIKEHLIIGETNINTLKKKQMIT